MEEVIRENRTSETEFRELLNQIGVFGYPHTSMSMQELRKEFLHTLMEVLIEDVNTRRINEQI